MHGYPLGYHGLNAAIKARAKAAGINNFHLHLLRHTYGHPMAARQADPSRV